MDTLLLVVLGAALASAAPPPPSFAPKEPYWLKSYAVSPYKESWSAELAVEDLEKDLPKILKAVEKEGGRLTQPLESFPASRLDHSQQLSLTVPKKRAADLVKRLRKLWKMHEPLTRPLGTPIPLEEVRAKIDRLMKERTERAAALSQAPAAAEASEEILEYLLRLEAAAVAEPVVLINVTVRGK